MARNEPDGASIRTRPLSYVNLSCSINGYSELTWYNSEARKELRSRESSRDRVPLFLNKSRDGSPLRPSEIPAVPFSTLGGLLSPVAVMELNNRFARSQNGSVKGKIDVKPPVGPPRSKSVDRGYLKREKSDRQIFLSSFLNNNNSEKFVNSVEIPVTRTNERYSPTERGRVRNKVAPSIAVNSSPSFDFRFKEIEVVPLTPENTQENFGKSSSTGRKSFVQQRIERLYGPGALARNYLSFSKSPKKPSETNWGRDTTDAEEAKGQATSSSNGCPTPPVFRHLRPEFREQLSLKKVSPLKTASKKLFHDETDRSSGARVSVNPVGGIKVETVITEIHAKPDKELPGIVSIVETESPAEGHKFLKVLQIEVERIEIMIKEAETYLSIDEVVNQEEVKGIVLAAVGKAKLLLAQKFKQFAGLCHKNIKPPPDDAFPTTGEDLAGFWDMVSIQVEHINDLFSELKALKKVNWNLEAINSSPHVAALGSSATPSATPKRRVVAKTPSAPVPRSAKAEEAAKARDEARRKMLEMKKNMAKSKGAIEIFA